MLPVGRTPSICIRWTFPCQGETWDISGERHQRLYMEIHMPHHLQLYHLQTPPMAPMEDFLADVAIDLADVGEGERTAKT
jgi:hypothetical protein